MSRTYRLSSFLPKFLSLLHSLILHGISSNYVVLCNLILCLFLISVQMVRHNRNEFQFFVRDGILPPTPPDASNHVFHHPNDNPSTILVVELLNGGNFVNWSRSMKNVLVVKYKVGFVDGSLKKPTDSDDPNFSLWD